VGPWIRHPWIADLQSKQLHATLLVLSSWAGDETHDGHADHQRAGGWHARQQLAEIRDRGLPSCRVVSPASISTSLSTCRWCEPGCYWGMVWLMITPSVGAAISGLF